MIELVHLQMKRYDNFRVSYNQESSEGKTFAVIVDKPLWFWMQILHPVSCLIIVDVQNDFISGTLALSNCPAGDDGSSVRFCSASLPLVSTKYISVLLGSARRDPPTGSSNRIHQRDPSTFGPT